MLSLTYCIATACCPACASMPTCLPAHLPPCLQELKVSDDGRTYKTVSRCPYHFLLTHDNKGFEGLHLHEHDGHTFMLGLCEGRESMSRQMCAGDIGPRVLCNTGTQRSHRMLCVVICSLVYHNATWCGKMTSCGKITSCTRS